MGYHSTHVLVVIDSLMVGGIEHTLVKILTHLDRSRYNVTVLCLYADRWGRSRHFVPQIEALGIEVQVLDLGRGMLAKLRGVMSIIRMTWRYQADILQAFGYHSNLLSRAARPLMPPRTRLIGAVLTEITARQLWNERLSWRLCTRIICNGAHIQQQLIEQAHIDSQKIEVILNGIDLTRFAMPYPEAQTLRGEYTRRLFLFLGRIAAQKAPQTLVAAFGEAHFDDEVRLWLVGPQQDAKIQAQVERAIATYGLQRQVRQFEATRTPEHFLAAADVLVLPSLYEGLPDVILEALAAGCPVILTDKANAAGVIQHGQTGWIVPTDNVGALRTMLQHVNAMSEQQLSIMREHCRQAAQLYSINNMIEHYDALYREVMEKH